MVLKSIQVFLNEPFSNTIQKYVEITYKVEILYLKIKANKKCIPYCLLKICGVFVRLVESERALKHIRVDCCLKATSIV